MKKTFLFAAILMISLVTQAQEAAPYDPFRDKGFLDMFFKVSTVVLIIYLISTFLLNMVKQFLDYKLKRKMLDKDATETIVQQLLEPKRKDSRLTAIKWAVITGGLGLGFTAIQFFPPFGIHSVMIMCFCVSLSFLCYSYFIGKSDSKNRDHSIKTTASTIN